MFARSISAYQIIFFKVYNIEFEQSKSFTPQSIYSYKHTIPVQHAYIYSREWHSTSSIPLDNIIASGGPLVRLAFYRATLVIAGAALDYASLLNMR